MVQKEHQHLSRYVGGEGVIECACVCVCARQCARGELDNPISKQHVTSCQQ